MVQAESGQGDIAGCPRLIGVERGGVGGTQKELPKGAEDPHRDYWCCEMVRRMDHSVFWLGWEPGREESRADVGPRVSIP